MRTHWWSFVLIVLTTVFTTLAQYFFKIGAERELAFSYPEILILWPILAGFVSYGLGAVVMILSFKGGDVSVLYPIVATSYVWVVLMGAFVFSEPLSALKIIGSVLLVVGIGFVAYGSRSHSALEYEDPP